MNLFARILAAILVSAGAFPAAACAQGNPPPPPFGEDPGHRRPNDEEHRERVQKLERHLRDLEEKLGRKDATEDQRREWRAEFDKVRAHLMELRGQEKHRSDHDEHVERLKRRIGELDMALQKKDLSPEQRKELNAQLDGAVAEMRKVKESMRQDGPMDPQQRERHTARLREIEAMLNKVGPEEREQLLREAGKLKDALARGGGKSREMSGKITAVADDLGVVVLSLGRDAGVNEGQEFTIHRDGAFIAKVMIDKVDRAWSSGRVVLKGRAPPAIGDVASVNVLQQGKGPHGPPPDPEMMKLHMAAQELDRHAMDLGAKLRMVPADKKEDRAEVLTKLKEVVSRLFDVREQTRAREVELLKKRLEELTQLLDKRKQNRDAIIEKRLKQLSGESDDLDW